MPEDLASALAGQAVDAEVHPEVPAGTLRLDMNDLPDGLPFLIGDDGIAYGMATGPHGSSTRTPAAARGDCHGIGSPEGVSPVIEASRYEVTHESSWLESWCPPTWWDLGDINIQDVPAADGERGAACIEVSVAARRNPEGLLERPVREGVEDSARLAATAHQAA
jgi:hypothetical protein